MTKPILYLALGIVSYSAYALPDYEPFSNATGSGGTSYTVGANLIGQTDAQGDSWVQAGTSGTGTQATIQSGDLTIAGLASSGGGASAAFGVSGAGASTRFDIGSAPASGTVYFSMAIDVTSTTGLTTSGLFFAGFNNSTGSQATQPTTVDARLYARSITGSPGDFNLGISKNGGAISYDSPVETVGSTIFVVGSYTFNTVTSSDDVVSLWVNPSSSTFGAATAPTPDVTDATGADITLGEIQAFELRDGVSGVPSGDADDLRIATDWADVTPPAPEPSVIALTVVGCLTVLGARRFLRK